MSDLQTLLVEGSSCRGTAGLSLTPSAVVELTERQDDRPIDVHFTDSASSDSEDADTAAASHGFDTASGRRGVVTQGAQARQLLAAKQAVVLDEDACRRDAALSRSRSYMSAMPRPSEELAPHGSIEAASAADSSSSSSGTSNPYISNPSGSDTTSVAGAAELGTVKYRYRLRKNKWVPLDQDVVDMIEAGRKRWLAWSADKEKKRDGGGSGGRDAGVPGGDSDGEGEAKADSDEEESFTDSPSSPPLEKPDPVQFKLRTRITGIFEVNYEGSTLHCVEELAVGRVLGDTSGQTPTNVPVKVTVGDERLLRRFVTARDFNWSGMPVLSQCDLYQLKPKHSDGTPDGGHSKQWDAIQRLMCSTENGPIDIQSIHRVQNVPMFESHIIACADIKKRSQATGGGENMSRMLYTPCSSKPEAFCRGEKLLDYREDKGELQAVFSYDLDYLAENMGLNGIYYDEDKEAHCVVVYDVALGTTKVEDRTGMRRREYKAPERRTDNSIHLFDSIVGKVEVENSDSDDDVIGVGAAPEPVFENKCVWTYVDIHQAYPAYLVYFKSGFPK